MDQELDAARHAWLTADQTGPLQCHDHLVHGRTADLEEALHVAFGRRSADHQGIGVDESQVLPLAGGEAGSRIA